MHCADVECRVVPAVVVSEKQPMQEWQSRSHAIVGVVTAAILLGIARYGGHSWCDSALITLGIGYVWEIWWAVKR